MFQKLRLVISALIIGILGGLALMLYFQRQKGIKVDLTKTTVMTQLQASQKLVTAEMTLQKIIEGKEALSDYLPGQQRDNKLIDFLFKDQIILMTQGIIEAGFDLSEIQSGSIKVNDDLSITISLPPAKILSKRLSEETKPFERQLGILTRGNIQLESEIRNQALENFEKEAISKGILKEAESNALKALSHLFTTAGITIKEIIIKPSALD
ncbi:MAG TPA: DUF4230 domain-containing protein [Candidatus Absconditabacterales bacterium]|nr:DUF4230 domain-containing protein [Candidatus Absconditabacterales bacterium]HMT27625.1 DUF4230 domain-containing protein [Candidatus Absconditabacterales bacterium]